MAQVSKQNGQRSRALRVGKRRGRFQLHVTTVNVDQQRRGEHQEEQKQIRRCAGDASKDCYRFRLSRPFRARIRTPMYKIRFPSTHRAGRREHSSRQMFPKLYDKKIKKRKPVKKKNNK